MNNTQRLVFHSKKFDVLLSAVLKYINGAIVYRHFNLIQLTLALVYLIIEKIRII